MTPLSTLDGVIFNGEIHVAFRNVHI